MINQVFARTKILFDSSIQAVIFDLDDTLYPERQYVRSGYHAVASALTDITEDAPDPQTVSDWLWDRFLSGKGERAFNAMSERFALNLDEQQIRRLITVYREHHPALEPFDGIAELLKDLHDRFKLGLISDGYLPAQEYKLDATGLKAFFDEVLFTESIGREAWKPAPLGFQEMARRLGVQHTECVYIADNLSKDFVSPNALGWRSVLLRISGQVHGEKPVAKEGEPDKTVQSVSELRDLLLS